MGNQRHSTSNGPGFEDKPRKGLGLGFIIVVIMIAFVGGSIIALAVTGPSKPSPVTTPAVSTVLPNQTVPPAPAQTAQTEDPLKKRRPLTDFLSPQEVENLQRNIREGQTQGTAPVQNLDGSSPSSAIPITANPNIPNPEPWQYDPVTNKHYHPGHGHWHQGKPPAQTPEGQATGGQATGTQQPSITNPEPWQYDPATNKYWHPGHNHWHNGQPPPPDQRN